MKHLFTTLIVISAILYPLSNAFAGEAGFIFQGKKYLVYKNGKKVGQTFQERFSEPSTKSERAPSAAIPDSTNYFLSFEVDGATKCYRWSTLSASNSEIFCVK